MAPARRRRSSSRGRSPGPATRTVELPTEHANDLLSGFKGRLHTVKTQELKLEEGTTITIARVKVPTPKGVSGHLIRRFDTDAVSASSLFRVAFPHAPEKAETDEMAYLAKRYNTKAAGDEDETGSGKLTGTWIPNEDAPTLAQEYGLTKFASELIAFEPPAGPSNNGTISSPAAPTPRKKSKSPAPPTSAGRSKRARVASPPSSMSTRSQTSIHALAPPTPSKAAAAAAAPAPASSKKSADTASSSTTPAKPASRRQQAAKEEEVQQQSEVAEESGETGGIQIVQDTLRDETTGEAVEEIQVTFTGAGAAALGGESQEEGLIGSEEQAREAIEKARELIESLKDQGVLTSSGSGSKRGRETEGGDVENGDDEEEEADEKPGVLRRWFGGANRKKRSAARRSRPELGQLQVMQSPDGAQVLVAQTAPPQQQVANRRRYIAMAGMVVMGAATAAAPYIFG